MIFSRGLYCDTWIIEDRFVCNKKSLFLCVLPLLPSVGDCDASGTISFVSSNVNFIFLFVALWFDVKLSIGDLTKYLANCLGNLSVTSLSIIALWPSCCTELIPVFILPIILKLSDGGKYGLNSRPLFCWLLLSWIVNNNRNLKNCLNNNIK